MKNKYKCLMNIDLDHKWHPEGSTIELSVIQAEGLLLSKAIEPIAVAEITIEEIEAEDLINKQAETIAALMKELEIVNGARDELERALLKAKVEISAMENRFESLQDENASLKDSIASMGAAMDALKSAQVKSDAPVLSNQPAVEPAPAKKASKSEKAAK